MSDRLGRSAMSDRHWLEQADRERNEMEAAVRELDAAYREYIDRLLHGSEAGRQRRRIRDARHELEAVLHV